MSSHNCGVSCKYSFIFKLQDHGKKTLSDWVINALQRTDDMLRLGDYSPLTIRNYLRELRWLFMYYPDTRPSQITREMYPTGEPHL